MAAFSTGVRMRATASVTLTTELYAPRSACGSQDSAPGLHEGMLSWQKGASKDERAPGKKKAPDM